MKNTFRQNSAQKNKTEFFWKNQFFIFSFLSEEAKWDRIKFELALLYFFIFLLCIPIHTKILAKQVWASLNKFEQVWTSLNKFDPV